MRYDQVYARRARRALEQGVVDLRTFLDDLVAGGVGPERAAQLMLNDLTDSGPIFGRFMRQVAGAASAAVASAERQGAAAQLILEDAALQRLVDITSVKDALELADPEALEDAEDVLADRMEFTWVAELENTCHLCLPLHGESRTMNEWREIGLHPDNIHPGSWASTCHCVLVPTEMYPRDELMEPLRRKKIVSPTGLKGSKKTRRMVTQKDLEKSQAAVTKARETPQGRRTLRLLGQVEKNPPGETP